MLSFDRHATPTLNHAPAFTPFSPFRCWCAGSCRTALFPLAEPTWQWRYSMGERGAMQLDLLEAADTQQAPANSAEPDNFTYMI